MVVGDTSVRLAPSSLAGNKFGRLTAIELGPRVGKRREITWRCRCECGTDINVRSVFLRSGHTQSCGCLFRERRAAEIAARKMTPELCVADTLRTAVVNHETGCIEATQNLDPNGYCCRSVNNEMHWVHRLVWEVAHGPTTADVLHSCDNSRCINLAHLRAGNQRENMEDMAVRLRVASRKLNPAEVHNIKSAYAAGAGSYKSLGREYGVHYSTIRDIIKGRSWRHLEKQLARLTA